MGDNDADPYLNAQEANFYGKLLDKVEETGKGIEKITEEQLEKHPDQSAVCKFKYYQGRVVK